MNKSKSKNDRQIDAADEFVEQLYHVHNTTVNLVECQKDLKQAKTKLVVAKVHLQKLLK